LAGTFFHNRKSFLNGGPEMPTKHIAPGEIAEDGRSAPWQQNGGRIVALDAFKDEMRQEELQMLKR
jgi:hypothetical protein